MIGRKTVEARRLDLGATDTLGVDLVLPVAPVALDAIGVTGVQKCLVRPQAGGETHAVWEEAAEGSCSRGGSEGGQYARTGATARRSSTRSSEAGSDRWTRSPRPRRWPRSRSGCRTWWAAPHPGLRRT
jgi:hypothetical protein